MSIQSKLRTVILFIVLIVLIVALNYYLRNIEYSADLKSNKITECDKKYSDIIFNEQVVLSHPDKHDELIKTYRTSEKMCADFISDPKKNILAERRSTFHELIRITNETKKTYSDVKTSLLDLFSSVKYIHEHHIAYLKNLIHRHVPMQDYYSDADSAFKRSPVKSATEPDIIKSAVSIQLSLLSIYNTFYSLQQGENLENIKLDFADRIKQFIVSVNTFEDYSLDAQDGILVEELLQNGRQFEKLFMHLLSAEHQKRELANKLEQNRAQVVAALDKARKNIMAESRRTYAGIELIQITTLILTILLGCWIVFTGKQIIDQVRRTVTETNRIQKDLSYQIRIDDSIMDEFKLGYVALNLMASEVNDHIKKLDAAYAELETRVKERTADLAQANKVLRAEIEDRKHVEQALRESEEKYGAVVKQASEGIYLLDPNSKKILEVNRSFLDMLGYTFEEISGLNIYDVVSHAKTDIDTNITKALSEKFYYFGERRYRHKNGTILDFEVRANLISFGGKNVLCVVLRDVTEFKRIQEEKDDLEIRLQRAEKMEAIGTLAGGVAHDLNNILSGLVSYPELLLMDLAEDNPLRKPILTIKQSGEKASVIVEDLLTLARRGVAITEVVDLNHIVSEYLNSPEYEQLRASNPNAHVEINLEDNLLNIMGSPVHLNKTVMNLLSNAFEATLHSGSITISTKNQYIDKPIKGYDEVKEGDYAVLSITDDGIGISPEDMERVFEPFYTKKVMGRSGTGLGMSVVWGTVKDHNGYIDIQSKEGKGTSFTLYFPITRKERAKDEPLLPIEDYMGNGESILVVDDVEEQREIATGMLEKLGYRVKSVANGEQAVEYMKNNSVDLIVLDMIMEPGINGRQTYERIIQFHPNQKAIIASGFSETDDVKAAQELGAGQYIKKPYTLEKIGVAIRDELKK